MTSFEQAIIRLLDEAKRANKVALEELGVGLIDLAAIREVEAMLHSIVRPTEVAQ